MSFAGLDSVERNKPITERGVDTTVKGKSDDNGAGKCPVMHGRGGRNRDWWPNQLRLQGLSQHAPQSNPMGEAFDYAKEFKRLDLKAVINDLHALMTDS